MRVVFNQLYNVIDKRSVLNQHGMQSLVLAAIYQIRNKFAQMLSDDSIVLTGFVLRSTFWMHTSNHRQNRAVKSIFLIYQEMERCPS